MPLAGFLSAKEAIQLEPSLYLMASTDIFVRAGKWRLFEECLLQQSALNGCTAGILVAISYSFTVCLDNTSLFLFDSHTHGQNGYLAAIVEKKKMTGYMQYFFHKWYPTISFVGRQGVAQLTIVCLTSEQQLS